MYRVVSLEPGLYTVGEVGEGGDWQPVADFDEFYLAQADAERRNSPQVYALLDKARQQIDEVIARIAVLEKMIEQSARVDNENSPDFHGY